jgi:hypothetical protein
MSSESKGVNAITLEKGSFIRSQRGNQSWSSGSI